MKKTASVLAALCAVSFVLPSSAEAFGRKKKQDPQPKPTPTPTSVPTTTPTDPSDEHAAREFWSRVHALPAFLAEDVKVVNVPGGVTTDVVAQLAQEVRDCGIALMGMICRDSAFSRVWGIPNQVLETPHSMIALNTFSTGDGEVSFVVAIEVAKNWPANTVPRVLRSGIYLGERGDEDEIAKDYRKGRLEQILEIKHAADLLAAATQKLGTATTAKELYQAAQAAQILSNDAAEVRAVIQSAFERCWELIAQTEKSAYQTAFLEMIRAKFPVSTVARNVGERWIDSRDAETTYRAALLLTPNSDALSEGTLDRVRGLLRAAMASSDNWTIRLEATRNLARLRKSLEDDAAVIGRLADGSSDVRNAAWEITLQIPIGEEHLPVLISLQANDSWLTRLLTVRVIGRIGTTSANTRLILSLADGSSDVRQAAYTSLSERTLTDVNLGDLVQASQNESWLTRLLAVQFIAKIRSRASIAALIPRLEDGSSDVRQAAYNGLTSVQLTDQEVPSLSRLGRSESWLTRLFAATLLGRIQTDQSSLMLIPFLADGSSDVRNEALNSLRVRTLNDRHVAELSQLTRNDSWLTRLFAVTILATISSEAATLTLIPTLDDGSSDVRNTTYAALEKRTLSESAITLIGFGVLSADSWLTRLLATRLLGGTSSCQALKLLTDRLVAGDGSTDVTRATREGIQAIRSRNGSCQ